jgi:hypothetical protein
MMTLIDMADTNSDKYTRLNSIASRIETEDAEKDDRK